MTKTRRYHVRPCLEVLEDRRLLAGNITNHGVVQNAGDVEAIFYGPSWTAGQKGLETTVLNSLHNVIDPSSTSPTSYLATLKNADYGKFSLSLAGSTNTSSLAGFSQKGTLTDADVVNYLTYTLNHPYGANQPLDKVYATNASRVYLVVVDPDDAVLDYNGAKALSYHRSFNVVIKGNQQNINYAVVAVPGGAAQNAPTSSLFVNPQIDTVTGETSRQLIDALTNPSGNGWFLEGTPRTEVGSDNLYAYISNNLVVRPLTKDKYPILPVQAAAPNHVTFLLDTKNVLWERSIAAGASTATLTQIATNVSKVSDQGIDQFGRAMIDYVTGTGDAYEVHDGATQSVGIYSPKPGMRPLGSPQGAALLDAKAGSGVSYVLLSNNQVWEYNDVGGTITNVDSGDKAIDAGTAFDGVNMVDAIRTNGEGWEVPDNASKHKLGLSNVIQISAGREGRSVEIDSSNTAWLFEDGPGLTKLSAKITAATAGTDANGNLVVDFVSVGTYTLTETDYATADSGKVKGSGVQHVANHKAAGSNTPVSTLAPGGTISKMRAGVIDMIFADGVVEGTIDGSQVLLGTNFQRAL